MGGGGGAGLILTNFERGARAEKTPFFYLKFSKSASKRIFWHVFFHNFACGLENLTKTGSF